MRCARCRRSLLHSQVTAGSPSRLYWVDYEGNRLGFWCPKGGEHEPVADNPGWLRRLIRKVRR